METITRKSLLYKSQVEYGDYACNHILGCSHGCMYPCYAYLNAHRYGNVKGMEEWMQPKLVSNAIELLEKELPKLKDKIDTVHLCFTSDPFMMGYPEVTEITMKILYLLDEYGIRARTLTKGIMPTDELLKRHEYGISMVTLDQRFQERYEPGASVPWQRVERLYSLFKKGFYTWVSMEPFPTPNIHDLHNCSNFNSLQEHLERISFVDKIIFGRWNYNPEIKKYKDHENFYKDTEEAVVEFCKANHIECIIKQKVTKKIKN